jgi:hypothetical protein
VVSAMIDIPVVYARTNEKKKEEYSQNEKSHKRRNANEINLKNHDKGDPLQVYSNKNAHKFI